MHGDIKIHYTNTATNLIVYNISNLIGKYLSTNNTCTVVIIFIIIYFLEVKLVSLSKLHWVDLGSL